uniref:Putative lipocalin n=1 Tax=Amblyomma cajennense TaxID=34607 RepID=A0A023FRX7_AMBCJ
MDLWPWYLLYLITVVMPTCPGEAGEGYTQVTTNGEEGCVSPWQFMSSSNIYLIKSNMSYGNITCIKARTSAKDQNTQTLSHVVYVMLNSQKWFAMNATYNPLTKDANGTATAFTSVDGNVTTNYTFALLDTYYAIVRKEKGSSFEDLRESCELWVNDEYFRPDCTAKKLRCEENFCKMCEPKREMSYDCYNCTKPQ